VGGLRLAGHVARMGEMRSKILVVIPKGKRPLGRPILRLEDIIRMDLRETDVPGSSVSTVTRLRAGQ
jgi:hypothetical protein